MEARMRVSRVSAAAGAELAGHRRHANSRRHAAHAPREFDQAAHRSARSTSHDATRNFAAARRARMRRRSTGNTARSTADDVLTIQVTDTDGVTSREPYRCRCRWCQTRCRKWPCGSPASARRSRRMPCCRWWAKSPTTTASNGFGSRIRSTTGRSTSGRSPNSRTAHRPSLEIDRIRSAGDRSRRRASGRLHLKPGADVLSHACEPPTATT